MSLVIYKAQVDKSNQSTSTLFSFNLHTLDLTAFESLAKAESEHVFKIGFENAAWIRAIEQDFWKESITVGSVLTI